MNRATIKETPWDAAAFGMPTYEITEYTQAALQAAQSVPGHYTIKVDPLANKRLLHEHDFYYCDTLLEPHCGKANLRHFAHDEVTVTRDISLETLLAICHGAFTHGRFHRDFNLPRTQADLRYDSWLKQLHGEGKVYGLLFRNKPAGFIACNGAHLALHAIAEDLRGQGLAKYFWGAACEKLFAAGHEEITSSISAANIAALNLYAALGFKFRKPLDIYHRLVT
ncbi:MAG: GNAT family N-acetyltransferase [Pseudomonadota bacterium]